MGIIKNLQELNEEVDNLKDIVDGIKTTIDNVNIAIISMTSAINSFKITMDKIGDFITTIQIDYNAMKNRLELAEKNLESLKNNWWLKLFGVK